MAKILVPKACADEGLECVSCTRNTATQLARVSKGLPGALLTQIFVQMYPNSECSAMHNRFAAAYRAALSEDEIPKKAAVQERYVRFRTAVA